MRLERDEPEASPVPVPERIPEPSDDVLLDPSAPALVPNPVLSALDAAYEHEVLVNLVQACERLFHTEWSLTLHNIRDNFPAMFAPNSTFLEPGLTDEYGGWESRGEFLDALRDAEALAHGELEPAAEDAGADDNSDMDPAALTSALLQPIAVPQPTCLEPVAGSFNWMRSHRFLKTNTGLACRDCAMIWPKPRVEA